MPLETDLSSAPYWLIHDQEKNFGKILFKPSVPPQVRELNELSTLLQEQIERMGDNIFKRGTIISGCNFTFYPRYPYAKLIDTEVSGVPVSPSSYVGYFVKNSSNVAAYIVDSQDGFESTDPNLSTIYLSYISSGIDGNTASFSAGDTLTVYDSSAPVHGVTVNNGGLNFSNNDDIVITPAVIVNVSTGTFGNGTNVYTDTAVLQVVGVDANTFESTDQVILRLRPLIADLANSSKTETDWLLSNNDIIRNYDNSAVAAIEGIIGRGAEASLITDGAGRIASVAVTAGGEGYWVLPFVGVKSSNNVTGITALNLEAENYVAKVRIPLDGEPVGSGYAFSVDEGIIYQKGFFSRVAPQRIIVSKYSTTPNAVAVGFDTLEELIDSNADTTLRDPIIGDNNGAPGADRLKLTPTLKVLTSEEAASNSDFFTLVEWSEGNPFRQNKVTRYNVIESEMATRASETSGDFVTDKFLVTTRSPANSAFEGNTFSVVVDPGTAYIDGYRVQTQTNYVVDVQKGIDTQVSNSHSVSLNYGTYVRINELGGVFQFSTGDVVQLYSSPKGFLSNTDLIITGNTTPQGTLLGTARVRSLVLDNGRPGVANTTYKAYLFNVKMASGKNFKDVRSLYYNGSTNKAIADVFLQLDATTNTNVAILEDSSRSSLLFSTGTVALKNANNVNYTYRTVDQTTATANNGTITKSIASSPNEFYPYSGTLSGSQMSELLVVPTGGDLIAFANISGNSSANTTVSNVVGTSTSFVTQLTPGDFVLFDGGGDGEEVRRVVSITNNTFLAIDKPLSFTNTGCLVHRAFPNGVPVPFGTRSGLSANVDANGNILTINFGMTFRGTTTVNTALGVNIERRGATQETKSANRGKFVMLRLANNEGKTTGPWCLGVPDIFRLTGIWIGNSTVTETTGTPATTDFYIDHNQTPNFLDLGFLYKKPNSPITLTSNDYVLVRFDHFTSSGSGYHDSVSYVSANSAQILETDSLPLANLGSLISSFEVPEIYSSKGEYYDLYDQFDFRPTVANTVAPASSSASPPVNPVYSVSFGNTADPLNDKKFPLPDSRLTATVEGYVPRTDGVFVNKDGVIFVERGVPDADPKKRRAPETPDGAMLLNTIVVPAYPNLPQNPSANVIDVVTTNMGNEKYSFTRINNRILQTPLSERQIEENQPAAKTAREIGDLERRISDLEYYSGLALLDSKVKDRVIPSSIDPALNRFKFGFFVDDYSTTNFSDMDNPSYSATIEEDDVVPLKVAWTGGYGDPEPRPYIDYPIVNQINSTVPPISITQFENSNCVPNSAVAYETTVTMGSGVGDGVQNTSLVYTMSSVSANAVLYFHNYSGTGAKIEIYQGNTLIKTSANASVLTSADKVLLQSNSIPKNWFSDVTFKDFTSFSNSSGGAGSGQWVNNSGKINWVHSPSGGLNYVVRVTKGVGAPDWKIALTYPVNKSSVSCPIDPKPPVIPPTPTNPDPPTPPPPKPSKYIGSLKVGFSKNSQVRAITSCAGGVTYHQVDYQNLFFTVDAKGLRPLTKHNIFFDGEKANKYSQQISPENGIQTLEGMDKLFGDMFKMGGSLITNKEGKIRIRCFGFQVYMGKVKKLEKAWDGKKLLQVISADETSKAELNVKMSVLREKGEYN